MKFHITSFFLIFLSVHLTAQDIVTLSNQNLPETVMKTVETRFGINSKGKVTRHDEKVDVYNVNGKIVSRKIYRFDKKTKNKYLSNNQLWRYDSKGRLIHYDPDDYMDKGHEYFYDLVGNMIREEMTYRSGRKVKYIYSYDSKNRMKSKVFYDVEGRVSIMWEYTYNRTRKIQIKKRYDTDNGKITEIETTWFKNNLPLRKTTEYVSSNVTSSDVTYEYDYNDNLIIGKDTNGSQKVFRRQSYTYDSQGNWVVKHTKSSSNHFYFRKIFFRNGKTSGSSELDKSFMSSKVDVSNIEFFNRLEKPNFSKKTFRYSYVNHKNRILSASGKIKIVTSGIGSSTINNALQVLLEIIVEGSSNDEMLKISTKDEDSEFYQYTLESMFSDTVFKLKLLKKATKFKGKRIVGYLNMTIDGTTDTYYLEE